MILFVRSRIGMEIYSLLFTFQQQKQMEVLLDMSWPRLMRKGAD